jgi:hypothetical protein
MGVISLRIAQSDHLVAAWSCRAMLASLSQVWGLAQLQLTAQWALCAMLYCVAAGAVGAAVYVAAALALAQGCSPVSPWQGQRFLQEAASHVLLPEVAVLAVPRCPLCAVLGGAWLTWIWRSSFFVTLGGSQWLSRSAIKWEGPRCAHALVSIMMICIQLFCFQIERCLCAKAKTIRTIHTLAMSKALRFDNTFWTLLLLMQEPVIFTIPSCCLVLRICPFGMDILLFYSHFVYFGMITLNSVYYREAYLRRVALMTKVCACTDRRIVLVFLLPTFSASAAHLLARHVVAPVALSWSKV